MKKNRKKVKEFSSSELINMAREAISNDNLEKTKFREKYNVDFTFMQLCNSLYRRKICQRSIITYEEYVDIKKGMKNAGLSILFLQIQKRYEGNIFYSTEL